LNCSRISPQDGHDYVLVGGYADSAFNAHFSTDLDIVVAPDSKVECIEYLESGHQGNANP
jgi:hypothetical protein